MQVPLQLQFKDMDADPAIEEKIRRRVDRLDRLCEGQPGARAGEGGGADPAEPPAGWSN